MSDTASAVEADIAWTERQRQVLDLLARGKTNPEIADILGVSLAGAKWHVSEVISKLGVTSREEAAAWWREQSSRRRQLLRGLRGLVAMPLTKIAGAAAGVAAVGAAVAFVALPLAASNGDEPFTQEPTPAPRLSVYTEEEAIERAKIHAQELILDHYHISLDNGRYLTAADYVPYEIEFKAAATTVATNFPLGGTKSLPKPTDVWTVGLALRPSEQAGMGFGEQHVLIVLEDGTGVLVTGGDLAPNALETTVEVARTSHGPTTFVLAVLPDGMSAQGSPPSGATVCLRQVDSRLLLGPVVTACAGLDTEKHGFMQLSISNNQNGFARAAGFVSSDTTHIRLVTEDGTETILEPTESTADPRYPQLPFISVVPAPQRFVLAEALDASGNVLDSRDESLQPVNR